MKVAFLVEHLDPKRGGMERSATEFIIELVRLGIRPHVITQSVAPEFDLAPVQIIQPSGWSRAGQYAYFIARAEAFLQKSEWDVIHSVAPCLRCNLYQPRSGVLDELLERSIAARKNWIAKWARRTGAVFSAKFRLLKALERRLLTQSSPPMVAALSSYMRRQFQAKFALPDPQIREVFNGVTVPLPSPDERRNIRAERRRELQIPDDRPVAIFVGHNFRRKGLQQLLTALADPHVHAWHLLVVGKDPPFKYQRIAKRLGISQRTHFLGSRPDVHHLFLAADAGFLPTYYDPCARTVLEGLSLGLPYVTTAYDGAADCIQSGIHGFVVESPESIPHWVQAFVQLTDRSTRACISHAALELRTFLSMHRHASQIAGIYEEIARLRRAS